MSLRGCGKEASLLTITYKLARRYSYLPSKSITQVRSSPVPTVLVPPLRMADFYVKIHPLGPLGHEAEGIFKTSSILPDPVEFGLK